jgi:hypothetical protein
MNRPLRAASGIAVFLMTLLLGMTLWGAFYYDRRVLTVRNFVVLGIGFSLVVILSLVASYFLISDAVKSK